MGLIAGRIGNSQPSVKSIVKLPIIEELKGICKTNKIPYEDQERYILIHMDNCRLFVSHTAHKVMFWVLGMGVDVEEPIEKFQTPEQILEWGTNLYLGNI